MKTKLNLTTGRVPDVVTLIIAWMVMVMMRMLLIVMKAKSNTRIRSIMKWVRLR